MARVHKLAIAHQEVIAGYNNNLTIRELGKLHGVSPGTIRNCLIANDVKLRKRGRRAIPKKKQTEEWFEYKWWQVENQDKGEQI